MTEDFAGFVRRAFNGGYGPYPYQQVVAASGFPDVLGVATGAGKTAAAVLPWLWRSVETEVDQEFRRLVYVLPMRTLVDQAVREIRGWLDRLGLAERVRVHVLMGGVDRDDDLWQLDPAAPAILVGTQDMLLSRALMRGYGEPRSRWPVSFALLHAGTQWVVDETQLLGPALATTAQLQGLRDSLGTVGRTATMWMSATLDLADLATPDHAASSGVLRSVGLTAEDLAGPLGVRMNASRTFTRLELPDDPVAYAQALAQTAVDRHQPGSQTLVFLNTVERARAVYAAIVRAAPEFGRLLVHSQFRGAERQALGDAVAEPLPPQGRIVVATQALEAGVDISSRTLVTEVAPWSSVVQRAGRCNRAGEYPDGADVVWCAPPKMSAAPYEEADLRASAEALAELEGRSLTTLELQAVKVPSIRPVYSVLRRRDLMQLFDTAPDLSGADIDVGPWIRDGDDATVLVAWRTLGGREPGDNGDGHRKRVVFPTRAELCPAPVGEVRRLVQAGRTLWTYDRSEPRWRRCGRDDVVPGAVLLADAANGGYLPETGWSPKSRTAVDPVEITVSDTAGSDEQSFNARQKVSLTSHLHSVGQESADLIGECADFTSGLSDRTLAAVQAAARYHDLGKALPGFQDVLLDSVPPDRRSELAGTVWAKSPGPCPEMGASPNGRRSARRRIPRHDLACALMLFHPECHVLDGEDEADLIGYLVAAHHGKVRVSIRSRPGEDGRVLGIAEGDETLPVLLPDGRRIPALALSLEAVRVGATRSGTGSASALASSQAGWSASWTERALMLRDRPDLGPFRLAWLETLVRIADWRVSKADRKGAW
ncbi:DEAD/DEAH box helicase [Actinomadura rayongensis]|uniref:DEAD/DEAH box helicase n=1 Tax=Actinomadura rayongensis TaxID=1429076 RepID=A0A6I4W9H7_9ACTN|nr:DEAD/DEAH box helicase [Actinomadura rayongensis]MXQ64925.1 DEAD/DEAH box helicase [Actinomadura rayongensis]